MIFNVRGMSANVAGIQPELKKLDGYNEPVNK